LFIIKKKILLTIVKQGVWTWILWDGLQFIQVREAMIWGIVFRVVFHVGVFYTSTLFSPMNDLPWP